MLVILERQKFLYYCLYLFNYKIEKFAESIQKIQQIFSINAQNLKHSVIIKM